MANYVSNLTVQVGDNSSATYNIRELFPHVGTCSTAAATAAKEVTIGNFKLYTGAWVVVKFNNTNSAAVASLTLNVDGTGAKPIKYRNANLASASQLIANRYTYFIYDGTNYQIVSDFNSDTYDRTSQQTRIYAGTIGVFNYSLCAMDNNQRMQSFTTTSGTGTSKTFNTSASFMYPAVIMYNSANSTYADGTAIANNVLYEQYPSVDLRYSCNVTSTAGFTQYKPVYLECTINSDGTFKLTTTGLTQTFTNGKYYILLGCMYNTSIYQLALFAQHPMFYYDGTHLNGIVYTAAEKTKLSGIANGATKVESSSNGKIKINGTDTTVYTHPSHTSKTSGLYKITVDSLGHVSATAAVAKGDIPALDYSKVSISRSLTSGTKIGSITIDGTSTDLYCQTNTNTDTLVSQTFATADKNRPLLMSYYDTGIETTTAQVVHRNDALFFNPSSGILRSPRLHLQTPDMPITINLHTLQPTAGENVNLLKVLYKNTDGTVTHTVFPIGILGNDATGSSANYNSGVRLGSTNGTTIVGAGESSITFAAAQAKYNDESLYLVTDQAVYMYTNCSNDATTVTGPWRVGGFTTGTAAITSGRVMITDGTTGGFKASDYTIAKSVPSDAKFSDTVTTVTTSGSGNAVTSITASNGALTVTKGSTFSLSNHTHTTTIAADSGTNQLTLAASTKYKLTTGGTNFIFTTPPNTTYSAGTGLSLSSTTINHTNSVTVKDNYNKKFFTHDAQGHITETNWYIHEASGTNGSNNDTTWIKIATLVHTSTYNNSPITITFTQRGNTTRNRLTIRFSSVNSKDPSLALFLLTCDALWALSNSRALIVKTATSTWDIYIKKLDTHELIHVSDFDIGSTGATKLTWTWKDEQVTTTPADATEATKKVYSTTDHTHSYAGSSSAGGAATSANKLNTDAGGTYLPVYFSSGVPTAVTVKNNTSVGTIGWTSGAAANAALVTVNSIAYWNGAYSGTTSNLAYCKKGEFGSIVTKSTTDYSKVTSSTNGKIKIDGTDTTVYTHPSHTSKTSGLYKITVDSLGHVSATASVAKGDIPALDYLPLAGGTMDDNSTIVIPGVDNARSSTLTCNGAQLKVSTSSNWAMGLIYYNSTSTSTSVGFIGAYGTTDAFESIRFGAKYDNWWIKITDTETTITGDLVFSTVSSTTYPAESKKIKFGGGTDWGRIYYRVDAADAGRLVFDIGDDSNARIDFAYNGTTKSYIDTSGNFSGNAATSSSWATAKTLTLSGQLTGSVSVKGDANMTLSGWLKKSLIYDETSDFASYAWHKFAENTITTKNEDQTITFIVSKTWGNVPSYSGILTAHIRTGSTKVYESSQFYWQLANSEIDPENFVFVYTNTANTSCNVELWYKQTARYDGWIFTVLKEHSRTSNNNVWTLYTSTGHGSASHTTGTNSYASSIAGIQNNTSGTSSNVTGTVAIAHGGTGATDRLNALKALTNEGVGTNAQYFLTITQDWGKGGYSSVANVKTVLGLKSAAYTASTDYLSSSTKYAASSSAGGAATWATLLKAISTTTTASASTWNIPSGSYQVWGERFSDTRLKYTPSGGSETTITDTGDLVMWLTGNAKSNKATLNMCIDGTYYGSFSGNITGNVSGNVTGNVNGKLYHTGTSSSWWNDRDNAVIRITTGDTGYRPLWTLLTATSGSWGMGNHTGDDLTFNFISKAVYNSKKNPSTDAQIKFTNTGGITATGSITANKFYGDITDSGLNAGIYDLLNVDDPTFNGAEWMLTSIPSSPGGTSEPSFRRVKTAKFADYVTSNSRTVLFNDSTNTSKSITLSDPPTDTQYLKLYFKSSGNMGQSTMDNSVYSIAEVPYMTDVNLGGILQVAQPSDNMGVLKSTILAFTIRITNHTLTLTKASYPSRLDGSAVANDTHLSANIIKVVAYR